MPHDNYYETASRCFDQTIKHIGSEHANPAMWNLAHGLKRLAEGLLQQETETAERLVSLAKFPQPLK
jgi:hypothetical protein